MTQDLTIYLSPIKERGEGIMGKKGIGSSRNTYKGHMDKKPKGVGLRVGDGVGGAGRSGE